MDAKGCRGRRSRDSKYYKDERKRNIKSERRQANRDQNIKRVKERTKK